jgi:hypothetical protein
LKRQTKLDCGYEYGQCYAFFPLCDNL